MVIVGRQVCLRDQDEIVLELKIPFPLLECQSTETEEYEEIC